MQQENPSGVIASVLRTAALAAVIAGTILLGLLLQDPSLGNVDYLFRNQVAFAARSLLVQGMFAGVGAAIALVIGGALLLRKHRADAPMMLRRAVHSLSPLAPLAFVPPLLRWEIWKDNELTFLVLALGVAVSMRAALTAAVRARPLELLGVSWSPRDPTRMFSVPPVAWFGVVVIAAVAYSAWFSYYTSVWHGCGRSGYDLAIEDNILWNLLRGHFYKATPTLGPGGSHFARHATLVSYLLLPFYALRQSADMVLILQSILMGMAGIPLFLFGRRRVGDTAAALIAILYLMHPAVQESNLFEMHYIKLGTLPFWTTLWLLDSKRYDAAIAAAVVTLMVREDVATWILLLGAFGVTAGLNLRASLTLLIGGTLYVGIVKFAIMPSLARGQDELMFMYKDLLPAGKGTFAWAMLTALTNPGYLLKTLLGVDKLVYLLHICTPLVFIPFRYSIGWVAIIPGFVFSLLSTQYPPLVDIHFQYSPHFLAMLYPATIVALGWTMQKERAEAEAQSRKGLVTHAGSIGMLGAMAIGTLLCSSQFGAVIQQNTSRGGPIPYRFGWDDEGRARRASLDALIAMMPSDAKVAASAFAITQVSARPNAYSLSLGLYDADYILSTTNRGELVPDEHSRLEREVFANGTFGVVAIRRPFFLMRRGYSTRENAQVEHWIR
jgi:uncharacterized membrane protein